MTATKTAPKTVKSTLRPCACSNFEVGTFDGDDESAPSWTTDCDRQTKKTFAQGHDARFASFVAKGEMDGYEIRTTEGGISVTFPSAEAAAASISPALAVKVARMVKLGKEKAEARKASKKDAAAKGSTTPEPQPTTRQARIKVGRWEKDATIDLATGTATYAGSLGAVKTAAQGKYTEVA